MMMRPRDLFGVGIRILAVWYWGQTSYYGAYAISKTAGYVVGNPEISAREDAIFMIAYAIMGTVLWVAARTLVWLAYGDAPKADTPPPSN
jgi:hypothetical protein